jgi:hypothetical protein
LYADSDRCTAPSSGGVAVNPLRNETVGDVHTDEKAPPGPPLLVLLLTPLVPPLLVLLLTPLVPPLLVLLLTPLVPLLLEEGCAMSPPPPAHP